MDLIQELDIKPQSSSIVLSSSNDQDSNGDTFQKNNKKLISYFTKTIEDDKNNIKTVIENALEEDKANIK